MGNSILIQKGNLLEPANLKSYNETINFSQLKEWVKSGRILNHIFRYPNVELITARLETLPKPLLTALLLRFLSRGTCLWRDEKGNQSRITFKTVGKYLSLFLEGLANKHFLIRDVLQEIDQLYKEKHPKFRHALKALNLKNSPYYLRTDLIFGLPSGGSIGHIAGVFNNLKSFTGKPILLSTDYIPTVHQELETKIILPDKLYWDFPDLPSIAFNQRFYKQAEQSVDPDNISFIYQRYSTNNFSGVKLAKKFSVPFILEYNGSEIWINRNWGKPLRYEKLSEKIELLNLKSADVVVVVSKPMKEELLQRGVEEVKILVNPNGVDPQRYSPEINGDVIREKYNLGEKTVIGFIGTFGKWHGAAILALAFADLLNKEPALRDNLRLMMIGNGLTLPQVKEIVSKNNLSQNVIFPGMVSQKDGPQYLAACDILASPHVPNSDGTPFFGSPTKLFEYMAMEKPIVASNLDQVGEVLRHDYSAFLVKPGDTEELSRGLKALIKNENLQLKLAKNARAEVIQNYTWKLHTQRIITKLQEQCP